MLFFDKEDLDEFMLSNKRNPEGKTWSNGYTIAKP